MALISVHGGHSIPTDNNFRVRTESLQRT